MIERMKTPLWRAKATAPAAGEYPREERGLALLVVILMLFVVTTLAAVAAFAWIRYYDRTTRYDEKSTLAQIHRTLRHQVMDVAWIPRPTDALRTVASLAGQPQAQVELNPRGNPRVVLADPGLGIGPLGFEGLPYRQSMKASTLPRNPRLVLLSSAGDELPTNIVTGATLTTNQFNNLWMTAQGQVPADWNWNGNPGDLCIERMHLGDLFVEVSLRYYADAPQHRGKYTLDSQEVTTNAPALLPGLTTFAPYVIRGTYLSLYGTNAVLQFRDIVQDNEIIYTCRNGIWYRGLGRLGSRLGPVIRHPTPEEFADGLIAFLSPEIPLWSQNNGSTKSDLAAAIVDFLSVGAYDNQSQAMGAAQQALIDAWVEFTGASPNKP